MKAQLIGNREKAVLHVARSQLGLSEQEYRDLLGSVGVSSSRELTFVGFSEIMDRLRAAGFRPSHSSAQKSGMQNKPAREKEPMISKIGAILAEMKLPWSYADGIAKKMFAVDRLRWCSTEQVRKVLQALIVYQQRKAVCQEKTG